MLFLLISILWAQTPAYEARVTPTHQIGGVEVAYPRGYAAARTQFHELANKIKKAHPTADIVSHPVNGKTDADLTIASLYLPAATGKKLFILTSGIHGAEAATGHAIEVLFLQKVLAAKAPLPYSILVINSMNPYGFKHLRRANENNVDLNRNFASEKEFAGKNSFYEKNRKLYEPQYAANTAWMSRVGFYLKVMRIRLTRGKKALLNSVTGQYEHPKGIFYGGAGVFEQETKIVQWLINSYAGTHDEVFHVDLHTGFGERGRLHFFGSDEAPPEQIALTQKIFHGFQVDTGHDKDFYSTSGDFTDWMWKAYPHKKVIGMTFEFGTLDSQTIRGGLRSLWYMVLENQGHNQSYFSPHDEEKARRWFEQLFNPQDAQWQAKVLNDGITSLETTLQRFSEL